MMFFGFLLKDNTYIDGFKKVQRECTFSAFDRDRKEIYIKFIYRLFPVVDLEFPFSHYYFYGFFSCLSLFERECGKMQHIWVK